MEVVGRRKRGARQVLGCPARARVPGTVWGCILIFVSTTNSVTLLLAWVTAVFIQGRKFVCGWSFFRGACGLGRFGFDHKCFMSPCAWCCQIIPLNAIRRTTAHLPRIGGGGSGELEDWSASLDASKVGPELKIRSISIIVFRTNTYGYKYGTSIVLPLCSFLPYFCARSSFSSSDAMG